MGRRARIVVFVMSFALALVACGARVPPLGSAGAGPYVAGPVTQSSSAVRDGGGVMGGGVPTEPSAVASAGPARTASRANCRGGATDTGVTSNEVKLGLVASLTGPLPGQFNSTVEAVDSYVRMVNDAGGICGRKFRLLIEDDQGSGSSDRAVATKLVTEDKIFAFVGSVSAPDDSGIAVVSRRHKIPDVGFPLSWARSENPYTYGVPGQLQRRWIDWKASGTYYLNTTYGITQVAMFWLKESEVSILGAWGFEAAILKSLDGKVRICHEQPAGVLDNNFTNYVVAMQSNCPASKGPLAVYSIMENNANIKLAIAMKEQGFTPKVFSPTFSSYLPSFIDQTDGATEGAFVGLPQIPFERLERPRSEWTPGTYELKKYVDMLNRYYPRHTVPGSFGGPGWGIAALFFDVVKRCGANLTRACFFREIDAMGPFSANGFLAPAVPREHQIYTSDIIVQVRNGTFVEVRPFDKSGPAAAPDFWAHAPLFNWQKFFCEHQDWFPNPGDKKTLVDEC